MNKIIVGALLTLFYSCNFDCRPTLSSAQKSEYEGIVSLLEQSAQIELEECYLVVNATMRDGSSVDSALFRRVLDSLNESYGARAYTISIHDQEGRFEGGLYQSASGKIHFTDDFEY